jgi:hypothetical protein
MHPNLNHRCREIMEHTNSTHKTLFLLNTGSSSCFKSEERREGRGGSCFVSIWVHEIFHLRPGLQLDRGSTGNRGDNDFTLKD